MSLLNLCTGGDQRDEDAVKGSIVSLALVDAWIATVVTCFKKQEMWLVTARFCMELVMEQ